MKADATPLRRSQVFRLALLYFLGLGAVLLIGLILVQTLTSRLVAAQIEATIEAEIAGLAEQYQRGGPQGLAGAVKRRSAPPTQGLYLLVDPLGRSLAGNLSALPEGPLDEQGWVRFKLVAEEEPDRETFGRARIFELRGGLRLLVGRDLAAQARLAETIRLSLIGGAVATFLLALLGGLLLSRAVLKRIETVNRTSRRIVGGALEERIPLSGRDDEFDALAGNLNLMLDRIEELMAGLKSVSDNIAHDLRTPLARLRGGLERSLGQIDSREAGDLPAMRAAVEAAIGEADSLLRTFAALLRIAQVESGAPRAGFAPCDLGTVADDAVEFYQPLAEERGLTLERLGLATLPYEGDRDLLFQALANLIDNAFKASAEGDSIEVAVEGPGPKGGPRLVVRDSGSGIPAAERERVLGRFVRLEESRSGPGSGLGLSLVAAVAKLHGGEVVFEEAAPGAARPGLSASLRLPPAAKVRSAT